MQQSQRIAKLVTGIAWHRPFLSEGVNPVLTVPETSKRGNVLYHTETLVVGLFNQEAVVLNGGRIGRRRILLGVRTGAEQDYRDQPANGPVRST